MRTFRILSLATGLALISFGCFHDYEPEWVVCRPVEPGFLYGVGRCGKTERPSRARELAITRGMTEIVYQIKGECDYWFEVAEEEENGTVTLHAKIDGRTIHTLTGIQIMNESFYPAAKDGYTQDTTYVLIRVLRSNLPW
ncbi:MAG: hypothetical protein ACYTG7_02670 [Planctomycetota bacterium]